MEKIETLLQRYHLEISSEMKRIVTHVCANQENSVQSTIKKFYGQMSYHLGWMDHNFTPHQSNPGKLLRPALLLLAYEVSGAWGIQEDGSRHLRRALPAAAAIELAHNFTLLHDDIEDNDSERRHRLTVWKLWGVPQAINTGDGMFALARLALWETLNVQVEAEIMIQLGTLFDRTLLHLTEGQHLDISFEEWRQISLSQYIEMIGRKTATLMSCATEMGARLGTRNTTSIELLRLFGWHLGLAFQIRDDMLGIWATQAELGKVQAGDIYRRKKSLPIIHAFAHATGEAAYLLQSIYRQETPLTPGQVAQVLSILEQIDARSYCQQLLVSHCDQAHAALNGLPSRADTLEHRAHRELSSLIDFLGAVPLKRSG